MAKVQAQVIMGSMEGEQEGGPPRLHCWGVGQRLEERRGILE